MESFESIVQTVQKPHVVCIPYPLQGHINALLKFALLLHHRGCFITFVNTEYIQRLLLRAGGTTALSHLPDFKFATIPDGLPDDDGSSGTRRDIRPLLKSIPTTCLEPFCDILTEIQRSSDEDMPPVTLIISDAFMNFTDKAAERFGVPRLVFCPVSASMTLAFSELKNLMEKGYCPLKDEDMETTMDWIPGLNKIRLRDYPSMIRATDPQDTVLNFTFKEFEVIPKAKALILNTFEALESEAIEALKTKYHRVYSVGPVHQMLNKVDDQRLISISSSLWKEDTDCIKWLDSKDSTSVLYVNFGSITIMSPQQLIEFAWGLANSKKTFLWIIRPDLVVGDSAMLPLDFLKETEDRSMLTSWCPQEQVLRHKAVGGFLTHCGWNSTLESIASGLPLICWPFFIDQQMNCRFDCVEWEIGMEIDNNVKRDQVEALIMKVMDGEEGKRMKEKAMELQRKVMEAIGLEGSSSKDFDKLIKEVLVR